MDNKYPIQINLYSFRMWSVWDQLPNIEWSIEKMFYFKLPKADWKWFFVLEHSKQNVQLLAFIATLFLYPHYWKVLQNWFEVYARQGLSRIVKDCQPWGMFTYRSSTILSLIVVITIGEFVCSSVVRTIFRKLQKMLSWCSQVFSINNALCYMPCSPGWPLELLNSSINSMQQGLAARFNR